MGRGGRLLAGALAGVMVATLVVQASAAAAPGGVSVKPPRPDDVPGVAVAPVKAPHRPSWTAASREVHGAPAVSWPQPGRATLDLTPLSAPTTATTSDKQPTPGVRVGSLPLWVGPLAGKTAHTNAAVGRVSVEVTDQAAAARAGVAGLVVKASRADGVRQAGAVTVRVDYSGFAGAYGGDWASRLRMVTLPDGRPLAGRNDTQASMVSAQVPLAADGTPTTVAVTGGPSGDNGDYTATSLSPASTWQVSQQTGDFSWSDPLRAVPAVGGPGPSLDLSYSSASVDGRSAGTNTQGSWIGDGWDLWPGYIERQYRACNDDKDAMRGADPNNKSLSVGDQCWLKPEGNATISFNGRATELVKSAGSTWKGVVDDGSKIELLKDTSLGNGDNDGEYWKVTTIDGTQYYFGRNKGSGGASGSTATNSVWTTQVYGNHPDELGYQAGNFAGSRTTQGWRWNVDYVVDPHGNTMTYFYEKEAGAYGREGDASKRTTYDRGGWLSRIEYGNRNDAATSIHAAAQVVFDVADRCDSNCWSGSDPVKASWLDTPWDQYCKAAPCTDQLAPTYWTSKRLSRIRAQVYSGTGDVYNEVEWWTLRHTYLQSGDNEGKPMWLAGLTHIGKVTTAGGAEVSDPEIVFDPGVDPRPNRVDAMADGRSNLFRYRIKTITTETGAQIVVKYSDPECTRSALPSVYTNTKRCYPQYYAPSGEEPKQDWFHKYRVDRVDVYDNTGGFAHEQTNYDYLDAPAWHHDDSELVPEKKRTWGQFRGYGKVRVRQGLESGVQSATEYTYLRGMDGDQQATGTPDRDIWITDSQGNPTEDHPAYAGMLLEQTNLLGAGGSWISGTINTPVKQGPTATSGPLTAWMANVGTARNRTLLANGSTRWTKTVTTYNSDNLPILVDDLGDESPTKADDDRCTLTWYARNPANWMLNKAKRIERLGVSCGAAETANLPGDMLSSTRTTYDKPGNNWDTDLPTLGDPVKIEEIDTWTGATPNWITTSTLTYDANGRVTESRDALNHKASTTYTPLLAGPVTSIVVTNPMGRTATTTMATAWNLPVTTVDDANNARTDMTYDGLGRLLKVWLPGRAKSANPTTPNTEFSYQVRSAAPTTVTTKALLPSITIAYKTSITLYDGLMRQRQTQSPAPGGGRVITDTVYDSRGLVEWTSNPYYDPSNAPPSDTLLGPDRGVSIPSFTENVYDGAERLTDAILKAATGTGQAAGEKWRTHTTYEGERASVTPPDGGTATTTIVDARGRKSELREYKSPESVGSDDPATYDSIRYGYTDRDELATVTDAAGNTWRYTYDQRGRKIRDEDPDKGASTSTYDAAGQLTTTTDARNVTLGYTYDDLGRRTSIRDGSVTGAKRAEWIYDTLTNGVGKLTKSIRYEPAGSTNQYTSEITAYDTAGRPTASSVTIPASEGGLCASGTLTPCTYSYATTYMPDGEVFSTTLPSIAGMSSEKLFTSYTPDVGLPAELTSNGSLNQVYVESIQYSKIGQMSHRVLGRDDKAVDADYHYDAATARLTQATAYTGTKPEIVSFAYSYKDNGDLKQITDAPNGGQTADNQCYTYDYLRRLAEAWTPSSGDCDAAPNLTGLGGPAPYWQSYTYDSTGNRQTETLHAATNTVRTYTYPAQGGSAGSKPHAVTKVETTGATTKTENYTYDQTGNTKTRPGGTNGQTLTWDNEGHLATATDSSGTTSYVYDADGNRLIRRDPTGSTLYLPGDCEVHKPANGSATGTRYYTHNGTTIAARTSTGTLNWIVDDHHNTAEATINNADLAVIRRRTMPFGGDRGSPVGTWPVALDKGFVGGTKENTGLTHLGARDYDPAIGRFVSVDPVLDLGDPQQWQGYAYADNNPATLSDPAGTDPSDAQWSGPTASKHSQENWDLMYGSPPVRSCNNSCGGGSTPAGGAGRGGSKGGGDWSTRHNAARDEAAAWIHATTGMDVFIEYTIPGASAEKNGNDGRADIVAHDPATGIWYVWEVKHIGGTNGDKGAESSGPVDLARYIRYLKAILPDGAVVQPGGAIPTRLQRPDPLDPKKTLVTTSSVTEGRPKGPYPYFDGVIIYWTKNKDGSEDESLTGEAHETGQAAAAPAKEPGLLQRGWDWYKYRHDHPYLPQIPFITNPVESPILVP